MQPRLFLFAALSLTAVLFLLGGHRVSVINSEAWHDLAHVAALGAIAFAYARAWPRAHALAIGLGVALLGSVHELSQELTLAHAAELDDVLFNVVGAFLGAATARLVLLARLRLGG